MPRQRLNQGYRSGLPKKLVEKFGEEIFTVIDHYSVRLEEVDGIGPGRRAKDQSCIGAFVHFLGLLVTFRWKPLMIIPRFRARENHARDNRHLHLLGFIYR